MNGLSSQGPWPTTNPGHMPPLPQQPSSPFHGPIHILTLPQMLGQFIWLGRWSCGCTGDSARVQEGPLGPRQYHLLTAHTYMSPDSHIPGHIPKSMDMGLRRQAP